jgi:hypothetical protein
MVTGILDGIQAQTGNDLVNALVAAQIGSVNVPNIRQSINAGENIPIGSTAFIAPRTGSYQIIAYFDQNSSGARGGRGSFWGEDQDNVAGIVRMFDALTGGTQIYAEASGGDGAQSWQDFVTNGLVNLDVGQTYRLEFEWRNYTESFPSATADVTVGWQVISFQ